MEKVLQQNVGAGEGRGRHGRQAAVRPVQADAGEVAAQAQAEDRLVQGGLPGERTGWTQRQA